MKRFPAPYILLAALLVVGVAAYFTYDYFTAESAVMGSVTINYSDGTSEVIEATNPLTSGAVAKVGSTTPINSIVFTVKAKPSWTDTSVSSLVATWDAVGTVKVDGVQKKVIMAPDSGVATTIKSGTTYTVSTTTITGTELNSWIPFDYDEHELAFDCSIQCSFTPPNDVTKTIEGAVISDVDLKNIGFVSTLTVTVSTAVN